MSYFSTRIPTQWSPVADYVLSDCILLRPAGRIVLETEWAKSWHDSLFFISESKTPQQHQKLLMEWILFHAFFFACAPDIVSHFEMGKLSEQLAHERLGDIPFDRESNEYARDYDDIAAAVYFFHETDLRISYRTSFGTYRKLEAALRNLVALWLFPFQRGIENDFYRLIDPTYLDVMTKVTIVETIIGHPGNCETKVQCPSCGKHLSHRAGSEAAWRRAFLEGLPMTSDARAQYAALLTAAFDAIRHRTAHEGAFPTARFAFPKQEVEIYDHERAIREHRENRHALLGLTTSIYSVSRYLLLDKLFGFRFFPEIPTLKSWTNRPGWVDPDSAPLS